MSLYLQLVANKLHY